LFHEVCFRLVVPPKKVITLRGQENVQAMECLLK
jgi:hypothetical protein